MPRHVTMPAAVGVTNGTQCTRSVTLAGRLDGSLHDRGRGEAAHQRSTGVTVREFRRRGAFLLAIFLLLVRLLTLRIFAGAFVASISIGINI
jgi:hypothetical protein